MVEIICALIGLIGTALAAYMGMKTVREKKAEELRREETILILSMLDALNCLTMANTNAICGGHNNGNVEEAKRKTLECSQRLEAFKVKLLAHNVN